MTTGPRQPQQRQLAVTEVQAAPTPTASLADTTGFASGGAVSPVMLLSVIVAWILLLAALAAESAWRRR